MYAWNLNFTTKLLHQRNVAALPKIVTRNVSLEVAFQCITDMCKQIFTKVFYIASQKVHDCFMKSRLSRNPSFCVKIASLKWGSQFSWNLFACMIVWKHLTVYSSDMAVNKQKIADNLPFPNYWKWYAIWHSFQMV